MCAVVEAERTAQAVAKEKTLENQEANNDSSSSLDDYPAGAHGGQCWEPYLPDLYPGPTFVEEFFNVFKYCHASTLGFELPILGHPGEKLCYCPCGKFMKNWRSLFKIKQCMDKGYHCFHKNHLLQKDSFNISRETCLVPCMLVS
eukprot:4222817-Ditylum_brightwellii.AAC.2